MAIKGTYTDRDTQIEDVYVNIARFTGDKNYVSFIANVYESEESRASEQKPMCVASFGFDMDFESGKNIFELCYDCMKENEFLTNIEDV